VQRHDGPDDLSHVRHDAATAAGTGGHGVTDERSAGHVRRHQDGEGRRRASAVEPDCDQLALRQACEPEARMQAFRTTMAGLARLVRDCPQMGQSQGIRDRRYKVAGHRGRLNGLSRSSDCQSDRAANADGSGADRPHVRMCAK
jgi:hypothetical protein